jgi:hypothetical protein
MLQQWIKMANLVFEIEKKLAPTELPGAKRIVAKMVQVLEEENLMVLNPLGEAFTETRTDVEATIVGDARGKLQITDVIKPVIYRKEDGKNILVQRGVVLVGSKE